MGQTKWAYVQADGQFVDPARGPTGFQHDEVDGVLLEDRGQIISVCAYGEKIEFSGFRVKHSANRLEFPENECENFHGLQFFRFGVGKNCDSGRQQATREHGPESPDFNSKAPAPNPELTWTLSSLENLIDSDSKAKRKKTITPRDRFSNLSGHGRYRAPCFWSNCRDWFTADVYGVGAGCFSFCDHWRLYKFINWLLLRCLAENIRLLKKIAGLEYEGSITGPNEETIWSCGNCGQMLHSDNRCDSCGAQIEPEST